MISPIKYTHFGWKHGDKIANGKFHPGYDLNVGPKSDSDKGLPVKACADGVVVYAKQGLKGWGKLVVIHHPQYNLWTRYAHLSEMGVGVGFKVDEGMVIGAVGDAEGLYSPHLHFDMPIQEFKNWADYSLNNTLEGLNENYTDPLKKIEEINNSGTPDWVKEAQEFVIDFGISNGERPMEPATRAEVWEMFRKYHN